MSLYGSLFAGVSALSAQSQSMGMISDNIANVNTVGYKRAEASFSSLVTGESRSTAYSPGAVRAATLQRIDQQGTLQQSSSSTDIALSGNGFFVVQAGIADGFQEAYYTRAGQFSEDSKGYLVNPAGYYLMGWPVDQNGAIPAGSGDLGSLQPVDVAFLGGITRPTTDAKVSLNLDAKEVPYVYPLSSPPTQTANFSRSFRVYDSLGEGQDITMKFYHTTSPTATATGNVDIADSTNLFNDFPAVSNTATLTGTVSIATTLGAAAPGLTNGDSFVIALNNETATINLDPTWTATDLRDAINAAFSGSPASVAGGNIVLTASTPIQIKSGGSQPVTQANLQAIGLDFMTQMRDAKTFTLQVGSGAVQTVTINDGDSAVDLMNQINNMTDVNAEFDVNGNLVIAADASGQNLIIGGVNGGAPEITTAGFAALGLSASTYSSPAAPNLMTPLDTAANPQNWWQVEFTGPNGTVLKTGMVNFKGDGTINSSADPATLDLSGVDWGNGSAPQDIGIDISAFTQFSGNYNVAFTNQNGAELGLRTGVSIDSDGFVVARFSNGQSTKLYKLPVATFANANGLTAKNGNVFQQSNDSGEYNLREAGMGSAGHVESGSLEASNVDLADEFSKMIVTQRAYSAGTKVISTSDQMLEELLRLRQ